MTTPEEEHREGSQALAAATAVALVGAYAEFVPGLSEAAPEGHLSAFAAIGARLVSIANLRAARRADVYVARALSRPERSVPVLGLKRPAAEPERLEAALRAVVAEAQKLLPEVAREAADLLGDVERRAVLDERRIAVQRARVERLARAEPLLAAQQTAFEAMREHEVPGWIRVINADACERCVAWADGRVRPPTVPMKRHFSCSCIAKPVPEGELSDRDRSNDREPVAPRGDGGSPDAVA